MSREPQPDLSPFIPERADGDGESLRARVVGLERAYRDVVERMRRYERERAEIKSRLERLLDRIGARGAS